jgi:glycosyltransferase involved in cell wall biosynthesis
MPEPTLLPLHPVRGESRPTRLAIVLSHPTQYYSPWFRWVAAHTDITLRVFYLWNFGVSAQRDPKFTTTFQWDVDLLSGYDHEFVPNTARDPGTHHFWGLRNPKLIRQLARWSPDALLVFGYKSASHLRVIWWARRYRVPLLFRGDSHFLGRGRPAGPTAWLLRRVYAQFKAVLPVGLANADYFNCLGVQRQRQFFAPHSVDESRFDPNQPTVRAATADLRRRLGLSLDTRVVLFAGKLVREKQPAALLQAFIRLALRNTALVFVGDGPEKNVLTEAASNLPVSATGAASVHFLPFANQSEMPARYLMADVFALPSRGHYETWGLAVNEAMHMGVPALVSDVVGCQRDLVSPDVTGWVFSATDPGALDSALTTALAEVNDPGRRDGLRAAVRARIANYTYAQTTAGLLAALAAVLPLSSGRDTGIHGRPGLGQVA